MPKIGLISDTHGYIGDDVMKHLATCDEIWHAGDFGGVEVSDTLSALKPLRGVYGNIDGADIRIIHPKNNRFVFEGFDVWITHIGGYPGNYSADVRTEIKLNPPDIFISGHSHICKVMTDKKLNNLIHINPGAVGKSGFHIFRTMAMFVLENKKISNLQVVELGKRA